jgi:hypothetical protein
MLEILRTLSFGATAGTVFTAVLTSLPVRLTTRLTLGAVIGAWISLVIAIAGDGVLKNDSLALPLLFALPLAAVGVTATFPDARKAMMAISLPLIVSLNVLRALGVFMLLAAAAGTMSGPFPYSAVIGDIITGIFALPVARIAARSPRDVRVLEWNLFGTLDLVVAVFLGVASVNGGALQLIHAGVGSYAMTTLPWAMIPVVLVPTFLIGHALVFAHMRAAARAVYAGEKRASFAI